MKTLDVKINLDPVNDGAVINPKNIMKKKEGALVIATNGDYKIISEKEATRIMEVLSGSSQGEYMGKTAFLAIFNGKNILHVGGDAYFVGSMLILKNTAEGLELLEAEDFEKAKKEFKSRLVTLVGDGQEFSAYELM